MEKPGAERPLGLILVMDGSADWRPSTDAFARALQESLGSSARIRTARFDADPDPQTGGAAGSSPDKERIPLPPRTPMRDALAGSISLMSKEAPENGGVIVVIVHEESYPGAISPGRLIREAQHAHIAVHSTLLTAAEGDPGAIRRAGRAVRGAILWFIEEMFDEPRNSRRQTANLLQDLAEATRAYTCSSTDESSAVACAKIIASRIREASQ